MKIGTDVSLKTCWEEGYMIMDFKVRELYPNGRKQPIDPDCQVHFYASDGGVFGNPLPCKITDSVYSWNDLLEIYRRYQKEIDTMCGFDEKNPRPGVDTPDEYVMLHLASDINAYCGLD